MHENCVEKSVLLAWNYRELKKSVGRARRHIAVMTRILQQTSEYIVEVIGLSQCATTFVLYSEPIWLFPTNMHPFVMEPVLKLLKSL